MTANYFLDTSFLIDLIDEREDALALHEEIAGEEATGTVCVYELSKFAAFDPDDLLDDKAVVQFSSGDAAAGGAVYRELERADQPIGETDTIIAGTVRNRNLTLVTRDEDFRRVEGVETRYY